MCCVDWSRTDGRKESPKDTEVGAAGGCHGFSSLAVEPVLQLAVKYAIKLYCEKNTHVQGVSEILHLNF